jgi:hypothetical protein
MFATTTLSHIMPQHSPQQPRRPYRWSISADLNDNNCNILHVSSADSCSSSEFDVYTDSNADTIASADVAEIPMQTPSQQLPKAAPLLPSVPSSVADTQEANCIQAPVDEPAMSSADATLVAHTNELASTDALSIRGTITVAPSVTQSLSRHPNTDSYANSDTFTHSHACITAHPGDFD